jgi:hypothetical protein
MPYDNVYLSFIKEFHIGEHLKVQFRPEFFTVFNIQNYGIPGTTYGMVASA